MRLKWDDPHNPVVAVVEEGSFKGLNIRQADVELAKSLDLEPEKLAIARQPLTRPTSEFDWSEDRYATG